MIQKSIKFLLPVAILFFVTTVKSFAHDEPAKGSNPGGKKITYFSSETISDVYELLLRYDPMQPGKPSSLKLFISDAITNAPIDSAKLNVTTPEDSSLVFKVTQTAQGQYEITGTFPQKKEYSFTVNLNAANGPDLLLLSDIDVGKELPKEEHDEAPASTPWYKSNWFFAFIGFFAGLLLMFFVMKKRRSKITTAIVIFLCILPASTYTPAMAHDEPTSSKSGAVSTTFMVEKETQFLFKILTVKTEKQNFAASKEIFATVVPAPQGMAVIQSPQTGRIVSLNVNVGQHINKGQAVATIEQSIDAGTQINIISQKNSLESEYEAAKAQYERLKSIEDIAAKKDVTEAKARYESALKNKQLFDANAGKNTGSNKLVTLFAPISGIVGTFNYSIGSVISAGQTVFQITNLEKVYAEAQVFTNDVAILKQANRFTASSSQNDTIQYNLKLISAAQDVNAGNQSQRVLFEVLNTNGQLKIGENIHIRMYTNDVVKEVVVPSYAIIDVNGKPAVFVKDKAEQFTVSFVQTGDNNGKATVILKGIEEGEHVITNNVYQMKMIYQNQ